MAISKTDVLNLISGLSVLELSELIKGFEDKFGVKAEPVVVNSDTNNTKETVEKTTEYIVLCENSKISIATLENKIICATDLQTVEENKNIYLSSA